MRVGFPSARFLRWSGRLSCRGRLRRLLRGYLGVRLNSLRSQRVRFGVLCIL
jgi:hypothetical protein